MPPNLSDTVWLFPQQVVIAEYAGDFRDTVA
jgi:hypothetical protein